jgi:hypothetical protein
LKGSNKIITLIALCMTTIKNRRFKLLPRKIVQAFKTNCLLDLMVDKGKIDNVTIGRTDLSQSYFDSAILPDSPFILGLMERLSCKTQVQGMTLTVGGSLTLGSIQLFQQRRDGFGNRVVSMETRKVVLPFEKMLGQKNALKESLRFEELYLRHKLECEAWLTKSDWDRLNILKTRI